VVRLGRNPAKDAARLPSYGRHRIIVPVHIPRSDGYFARALEILALSLTTLRYTTEGQAAITVVANGCGDAARGLLEKRFAKGWIDQLIFNEQNRGKVDALASVARGAFEPFVTISDCDVIFRHGWLDAVEEVFRAFPHAGIVSPFSAPPVMWHHTSSTLLGGLTRGQLKFAKVVDDLSLDQLSASVGDRTYVEPDLRRAQLTVQRGDAVATVGAVHIVCTMRREVVAAIPESPSLQALARGSENAWFDEPADRRGYWRLSTPQAFAMHMGNEPEPWMVEALNQIVTTPKPERGERPPIPEARADWPRLVNVALRSRLVGYLQRESVRRRFFRRLGHPEVRWPAPAMEQHP
jgi:hypothetical protein